MDFKYDITQFTLSYDQLKLTLSLKYQLVLKDITLEKDEKKKVVKKDWLHLWKSKLELFLQNTYEEAYKTPCNGEQLLIVEENLLKTKFKDLSKELGDLKVPLYLMLLDLSLYSPYYEIWDGDDFTSDGSPTLVEKFSKRVGKFKKHFSNTLYNYDRKSYINNLKLFVKECFGVDPIYVNLFSDTCSQNMKFIYKKSSEGLIGASSIGTILTSGAHQQNLNMLISPEFVASQSAKFQTAFTEIILDKSKDVELAQALIYKHSEEMCYLYNKIIALKLSPNKNKAIIKDAEEAYEILGNSVSDMEKSILKFDKNKK